MLRSTEGQHRHCWRCCPSVLLTARPSPSRRASPRTRPTPPRPSSKRPAPRSTSSSRRFATDQPPGWWDIPSPRRLVVSVAIGLDHWPNTSPGLVKVLGIEHDAPFVVLQGFVSGGLRQIGQRKFHRFSVLLRIEERDRKEDLKRSTLGKLAQPLTQRFLRPPIFPQFMIRVPQAKERPLTFHEVRRRIVAGGALFEGL